MKSMRCLLIAFAACASPTQQHREVPMGPAVAEAPPTSGTEATAPPQPAPELANPAMVETASLQTSRQPQQEPPPVEAIQPPPGKIGSPRISKGKPTVSSSALDRDVVMRYLNKNSANFQQCYEKALLGNPAVTGEITLMFSITATGGVEKATTTGEMDNTVEKCVTDVASRIAFPKPSKGSVDVTYPMAFEWK